MGDVVKPKYFRARTAELEAENRELRDQLTDGMRTSLEQWETTMPENIRDALAARALISSNGDLYRAAAKLGFGPMRWKTAKEVMPRIFATPGVKEILARDLKKPEENRQELLERQVKIALYGDDSASVKSFQMLAKVCGWVKAPDVLVQNNRQTILALVTQKNGQGEIPEETLEALPAFLEHEPGAAVRIDSGDIVALAQGTDEE